jgi:2-oxoglutarate ferredoxin oxidoreductase subunit beta
MVEILTQCPTYFGRLNRIGEAADMLVWERDVTEDLASAKAEPVTIRREDLVGSLPTGIFRDEARTEYTQAYRELCARVGGTYGA